MKTFDITANGGMPAYLNDLRFMESVHKDAFEALLKPYANLYDVIILSGCSRSVTTGTVTVTEGWIIYLGEIMRVEEQTYTEPTTDSEYWVTNTVDLVGGQKIYFDSSVQETWKETLGLIEVGASIPPNSLTIQNTPTYFQVIDGSDGVRTKMVEIGAWNMDADQEKIYNLPTNWDKEIIGAEAYIQDINGDYRYPIDYPNNGDPAGFCVPDKSINGKWRVRLYRYDTNFFDQAFYNHSGNAGWIIIKYLP